MITSSDVLKELCSNYDTSDYPEEELIALCETGLRWVNARLKKGVSESDPLIAQTASAIAHYHFFIKILTEPEKYESYRVGDITVNCDPSKALEREKAIRDNAIADAATILTDGGFYCCGY